MESWYQRDREAAGFYFVYIAEAHPTDEWQVPHNAADGVLLQQHRSLVDRREAARLGRRRLGLTLPTLLDNMQDAGSDAYAAWPERIYIIDANGYIAYQGGPGPGGFDPDAAADALSHLHQ